MTTTADELINDLLRRADACDVLAAKHRAAAVDAGYQRLALSMDEEAAYFRALGKAAAYRHAAELVRDAVAAAVAEEREACARMCDEKAKALRSAAGHGNIVAWDRAKTADDLATAIRGRAT